MKKIIKVTNVGENCFTWVRIGIEILKNVRNKSVQYGTIFFEKPFENINS
jgi:hypothetical protein